MFFSQWISDRIIQAQRWGFVGEVEWSTCFNGTRLSWPQGPEKRWSNTSIFDFGSYIWIVGPKTIWQNSWTSHGSLLRNLLITSQRWHVPKEMKTRKINKGSCLITVNHGKTLKANPMQKSCRSSMWSTSFEEKCRCDFPTKSLQDSGRHPKADAETGSGARGLSFHLVGKCWLV